MSDSLTSKNEIYNCPETRVVLTRFVDNLPNYVEKIRKNVEVKDLSSLSASAHQLKGTAACFGYQDLSVAAQKIEESAADFDPIKFEELLGTLEALSIDAKRELETGFA